MRVAIIGACCVGLEAAIIAARCQIVEPYTIVDRYAISCKNNNFDYNIIEDEDYAEQTPPSGRSGKSHNLILSMNKKGRKW